MQHTTDEAVQDLVQLFEIFYRCINVNCLYKSPIIFLAFLQTFVTWFNQEGFLLIKHQDTYTLPLPLALSETWLSSSMYDTVFTAKTEKHWVVVF